MKTCVHCGKQLDDNANFCTACGAMQPKSPADRFPRTVPVEGGKPAAPAPQPGAPVSPPQKKKGGKLRGCLVTAAGLLVMFVVVMLLFGLVNEMVEASNERARKDRINEVMKKSVGLVQNNLDLIYLGTYDDAFLKSVDMDQEEAESFFQESMEARAERFANSYDIEYLTDDLRAELTELFKEIFSHAKYEVGEAHSVSQISCNVDLTVYPMDILLRLSDAIDSGGMDWFWEKYAQVSIEDMDEAAYQAFDRDWAEGLISLLRDLLPEMGYLAPRELEIRVSTGFSDTLSIEDASLSALAEAVLMYPSSEEGEDAA